jgi:DNA-binding NtrC family response regulator
MKTILLADDDRLMRTVFKRVFEDEGYGVILARDGTEALNLLRTTTPDAVVLDICMPGKDGLDVAEEVRTSLPGLPIILYTGHDDICTRDDRARFATVCVEKRTDLAELKRAVVRVLSSSQGRLIPRIGLPPVATHLQPHQ